MFILIFRITSMIRRFVSGYEHYECSNCGKTTYEDAEYCQICGHSFGSIQNNVVLKGSVDEDETVCIFVEVQKSGVFTFTQLKKDVTPKSLLNLSSFQGQRMMAGFPTDIYVFKTEKYPYLSQDAQINLNLNHYHKFETDNGWTIYFDHRHFSQFDIAKLKRYNFS